MDEEHLAFHYVIVCAKLDLDGRSLIHDTLTVIGKKTSRSMMSEARNILVYHDISEHIDEREGFS